MNARLTSKRRLALPGYDHRLFELPTSYGFLLSRKTKIRKLIVHNAAKSVKVMSLSSRRMLLRKEWQSQHHVVRPGITTVHRIIHYRFSSGARYGVSQNRSAKLEARYGVPYKTFMVTSSLPSATVCRAWQF